MNISRDTAIYALAAMEKLAKDGLYANLFADDASFVRAAMKELREVASQAPSEGDAARLDWLLHNLAGSELRRIGIHYGAGATRADIDRAIAAEAAGDSQPGGER